MKPDAKKILAEALQLNASTRALIADELLASLDVDDDFLVSGEWQDEIRRRCAEIDRDQSQLIDGRTAMQTLRDKYA